MLVLIALLSALLAATSSPAPAATLDWEVVSRRPHDRAAFTQGLLLDEQGRLFESVGQWGRSDVREVDPSTGLARRARSLGDELFGEGLALVGGELVQLTWKAGLALRWDRETFSLVGLHRYEGEGWGLCFDGEQLVMSDGSDRLTLRDPSTFEPRAQVQVTLDGMPVDDLNELECVGDAVWANVWKRDTIYRIDPVAGRVTGVLDLRGLLEPHPAADLPGAVLNGIAWDARAQTFLVTGKYWPEIVEIRVQDGGG